MDPEHRNKRDLLEVVANRLISLNKREQRLDAMQPTMQEGVDRTVNAFDNMINAVLDAMNRQADRYDRTADAYTQQEAGDQNPGATATGRRGKAAFDNVR